MLSKEVIEALAEMLVTRVEEVNTYALRQIARSLRKLKGLTPTQANKLVNALKYGGDYNKITKKLAEFSKLSQRDVRKIFENTAKQNHYFAKQFYDYKNIKYIPYEQNDWLKAHVEAYSRMTNGLYQNISNTTGFTRKVKGKTIFTKIGKVYRDCIDRGIMSIEQGQESFTSEMRKIIRELSGSGLKITDKGERRVEYPSGYHRRLDSAVRQNLLDGIRQMTNEVNKEEGKKFGSDGVEIDTHLNPAPDHADVQGHQFYNDQFENFQNDKDAVDINGVVYPKEFDNHDRRSISQYNCYHNAFPIIVGISKPMHTEEELQKIKDDNLNGFELDGKHYTMYEGTQLQRQIETEIRKAKDGQIMARELDDIDLAREYQTKINKLTKKYAKVVNISNLPSRKDRMSVSGYHRISTRK